MCKDICDKFCNGKNTLEIDGTDRLPVLDGDIKLWDNLAKIEFCNIDFIEIRGKFDYSLWDVDRKLNGRMHIYKMDLRPMTSMDLHATRLWGTVTLLVDKSYDERPFIESPVFTEVGWNYETSAKLKALLQDADKYNILDISNCNIDKVVPTAMEMLNAIDATGFYTIKVEPNRSSMM